MRLQLIQGTVSEIVSNTYVTRITLDDETVWFRTSRAGRPPIETGDSVAVVAGTIGPERILIAIQIRRLRDARSFSSPHAQLDRAPRRSLRAFQCAYRSLESARLSIAGAAVGPSHHSEAGYLQAQIDIVARHPALVASQVRRSL